MTTSPSVPATLVWLTHEEGGRTTPPAGPRYTAPARMGSWNEISAEQACWSLRVDRTQQTGPFEWRANVSFVVPEAPHDALRPGTRFALYEGRRCVARGLLS
ncbi:MAG: hypothetical protein U0637_09865 [Phycisphaerales bacterium]